MNSADLVVSVLARRSGVLRERVTAETRLVEDLKLEGDDAIEALLEIARACSMETCDFDSSRGFHAGPALLSLLPFLRSERRRTGPKEPLTVAELVDAVRRGSLKSHW